MPWFKQIAHLLPWTDIRPPGGTLWDLVIRGRLVIAASDARIRIASRLPSRFSYYYAHVATACRARMMKVAQTKTINLHDYASASMDTDS